MKRTSRVMVTLFAILSAGLFPAVAVPPPPPGGGGIKPPDTKPPGRIYFEDNVVIVGPGFVKPDNDGGTVFVTIPGTTPGVTPDDGDDGKTVDKVVRQLSQVKSQVEAGAVAVPPGLMDPATLLAILFADEEQAGIRNPAGLAEEEGAGAAVRAAADAPAPRPPLRLSPGAPVIPSFWQLPIR